MAISSGVRPHTAFLNAGGNFHIIQGTVELFRDATNSQFNVTIAMSEDGALSALANVSGSVSVTANGETLIEGVVQVVDFDMIARNITVAGSGNASKLHTQKTAAKFTNKTGAEIVEQLVQGTGLTVDADSGGLMQGRKVKDSYDKLTDGVSLSHAISKLAERDGANWWVVGNTLHYTSEAQTGGSYSLNYHASEGPNPQIVSDCLRLVIEYNVEAAGGAKVTASSWVPHDKKAYQGTGSAGGGSGGGNPLQYVYHLPEMDQDHLMKFAQAKANEAARHAFTLDATVAGDPSIDPSGNVQLSGTQFFDGSYEIDIVRHNIGMGGYTTDIVAKTAGQGGGQSA